MSSKEIIFTGNIYCYISPPSTTSQGNSQATRNSSSGEGATFGPHHRRNVRNKLYKRKKKQEAKNRKGGGGGGVVVKAEVEHQELRTALEKALKAATQEKMLEAMGKTMWATGGESTVLLSGSSSSSIKKEASSVKGGASVLDAKTLPAAKPQYVVVNQSPPAPATKTAANPFKIDNRKQVQKNWAKKKAAKEEEQEEEEEQAKRAKRAKRFSLPPATNTASTANNKMSKSSTVIGTTE